MATIDFLGAELTDDNRGNLTFPALRLSVQIPNQAPFPEVLYTLSGPSPTGFELLNYLYTIVVAAERGAQLGLFSDLTGSNDSVTLQFTVGNVNSIDNLPGGVRGLAGNDRINTNGIANPIVNGNLGADYIENFNSTRYAYYRGGQDNDTLEGWNVSDILNGNLGNDSIRAIDGDDFLRGGAGNDTIWGGNGRDILIGDVGRDFLFGGDDNVTDTFVLRSETVANGPNLSPTRNGADEIFDFNFGNGVSNPDNIFITGFQRSQIAVTRVDAPNFGVTGLVDFEIRVPSQGNAYLGVVRNIDVRQQQFNGLDLVAAVTQRIFSIPADTQWLTSIG
jgi:Ca2+-binding RTX toxin-like protein